jgi:hypothetical protein
MVFNATFNNISVISWQSVLLVEENGVPGEHYRPAASYRQTLSHNLCFKIKKIKRQTVLSILGIYPGFNWVYYRDEKTILFPC